MVAQLHAVLQIAAGPYICRARGIGADTARRLIASLGAAPSELAPTVRQRTDGYQPISPLCRLVIHSPIVCLETVFGLSRISTNKFSKPRFK
jgi:hypothetical protein